MDRQSVYSAHVFDPTFGDNDDSRLQLQTQLETFILDFRLDNNFVYRFEHSTPTPQHCDANPPCRDQLRENALLKNYYGDVNINDLINFNEELAHKLASEPA